MMDEEEDEPEEATVTLLEPIIELSEPNEGESGSSHADLERLASVSIQTDDLKKKAELMETVQVETVSTDMLIDYLETEGEFCRDEYPYGWDSQYPVTPPPTPKTSLYFKFKNFLGEELPEEESPGEDFARDYYIPLDPNKGRQVSIDRDEPQIIPKCGEEKEKEEEKLPKKRAVFKDETLTEPGLKVAILDPETEKARAECISYAGVERFAAHFVDNIIDKSIDNIMTSNTYLFSDVEVLPLDEASAATTTRVEYYEPYPSYVRWPSIQEFTKEIGRAAINDYVQEWEYDEDWLYCIDFLMEQSDECSDYYLYDVKWSIPTKPYPIPQATASVYFTIQVCRVKPAHCTVDVTYQFEAARLIHSPGKILFQEKWLFDIIDAKIELFKKIKF